MTHTPNLEVFVNQLDGHNKVLTGFGRLNSELDGDGQYTHVLVGDAFLEEILNAWVEADKGQRQWALVGLDDQVTAVLSWIERFAPYAEQLRIVSIQADDDTWMVPLDKVAAALPGHHLSWECLLVASPEGS